VPRPFAQVGNAVLMAYLGDADEPAPRLNEVALTPDEARPLFDRLLYNVELFLAHDRIHGDLSAYNILYWQGAATIIDFAQAVDPRYNEDIYPLLERDIERLCRYFAPYGIVADPRAIASDMWLRYLVGELLR
jgi:RIO kinase 1